MSEKQPPRKQRYITRYGKYDERNFSEPTSPRPKPPPRPPALNKKKEKKDE